jgi:hypothetical protein
MGVVPLNMFSFKPVGVENCLNERVIQVASTVCYKGTVIAGDIGEVFDCRGRILAGLRRANPATQFEPQFSLLGNGQITNLVQHVLGNGAHRQSLLGVKRGSKGVI